jgi:hypothetical protein
MPADMTSNQSLEPTPFDCRSGQANWAVVMSTFDLMKQFRMFATLAPAWMRSRCPASLVRFAYSRSRTPAVMLLFNASGGSAPSR